jgi:hypothetical protein
MFLMLFFDWNRPPVLFIYVNEKYHTATDRTYAESQRQAHSACADSIYRSAVI